MIIEAGKDHIPIIQHIARETWPHTFSKILSSDQIEYMLEMMYSSDALKSQMNSGHKFLLAGEDSVYGGFASFELNYKNTVKTKLHKIYIMPSSQHKHIGSNLLNKVEAMASMANNTSILLNVNRNNPAIRFYQAKGFQIINEEVIDIGNRFVMDDFVMEKLLHKKRGS